MTLPIPGLRPSLISSDTATLLDKYCAFRHVFRNIYGFHLDPDRILELLRDLPGAVSALNSDLDRFMSEIHRVTM